MRREGNLIEQVADWENLQRALLKAARGKATLPDAQRYREDRDARLGKLREGILSGDVRVGDHRFFWVRDPKLRRICAASFEERVLHHALMNVCGPILDRSLIERLEPRHSRRLVQQLRRQLPLGVPQQERARPPQEQPGFPARPGPQLASVRKDGADPILIRTRVEARAKRVPGLRCW